MNSQLSKYIVQFWIKIISLRIFLTQAYYFVLPWMANQRKLFAGSTITEVHTNNGRLNLCWSNYIIIHQCWRQKIFYRIQSFFLFLQYHWSLIAPHHDFLHKFISTFRTLLSYLWTWHTFSRTMFLRGSQLSRCLWIKYHFHTLK